MTIEPIVLASSSPRRQQLLEMLRIPFRVIAPDVDEHVLPAERPDHYVRRLARAKAEAVAARAGGGALILAADTTVVLDGEIFGKPESPADAVAMLTRLQGRTHEVMTGVAVRRDGDVAQALDISRVTFRSMDQAGLESYVATGEPLDKAGAYAIQGVGALLIARVEGDVYGVMGLPLGLVVDLLARFGRPYRFAR